MGIPPPSPGMCFQTTKTWGGTLLHCMGLPNKGVPQQRHPTPTIEEVLHDLNRACHFSKLDLRQGFLQIPLAPESRNLTTLSTQLSIKRFTRMVFELSSAPEIFQHEIQKALQGIAGVKNINRQYYCVRANLSHPWSDPTGSVSAPERERTHTQPIQVCI